MKTISINTPTNNIIVAILHLIDHHSSHVVTDDNRYRVFYSQNSIINMDSSIPIICTVNTQPNAAQIAIRTKINLEKKEINITAFNNTNISIDPDNWTPINGKIKVSKTQDDSPTGFNLVELSSMLLSGFKLTTNLIGA